MGMANAPKRPGKAVAATRPVEELIRVIRGQKVMLGADLSALYGVPTKRLNEAVKRNGLPFPEEFMFQLSRTEADSLRSQIATSNGGRGGRRYSPYVFTEYGVVMLSSS
jgi:ORF6N domain-containing protein